MSKYWTKAFFVLLLVVLMLNTGALAAGNNAIEINGVNIVTAADSTVNCGNGTALYNAQTKTLQLTNAIITVGNSYSRGIDIGNSFEGLNIVLVGTNSISGDGITQAIYADKDITISGSGSLTISTKAESIISMADIIFDGAEVEANAPEGYCAITANGEIEIMNSAKVTANGYGGAAINGDKGVAVEDSTLKAVHMGHSGNAILAGNGEVTISNSKVTAIAAVDDYHVIFSNNGMSISGKSEVAVKTNGTQSTGLFNYVSGDIVISDDANVKIDTCWGIWNNAGKTVISGGIVEVNSTGYAFVGKPDTDRYADLEIYAGSTKDAAKITDPSQNYQGEKYVRIQPKEPVLGGDAEPPQTGDDSRIWLWLALCCVSLAELSSILASSRKRRTE